MQRQLKSLYVCKDFIKSKNVKNITFRCLRPLVHICEQAVLDSETLYFLHFYF